MDRDLIRDIGRLEQQVQAQTPTKRAVPIAARATHTTGQTIPNNTATVINFETKTFDSLTLITTGAAWKFTAPIAGYYNINAAIMYTSTTAWAAGEAGDLVLYVNGSAYATLDYHNNWVSAGTLIFMQLSGSDVVYLTAGQYLDLRTTQQSGAALALIAVGQFNYISISKV